MDKERKEDIELLWSLINQSTVSKENMRSLQNFLGVFKEPNFTDLDSKELKEKIKDSI